MHALFLIIWFQLPAISSVTPVSLGLLASTVLSPQKVLPTNSQITLFIYQEITDPAIEQAFSGSPCGTWTPLSLQISPLTLVCTHIFSQLLGTPEPQTIHLLLPTAPPTYTLKLIQLCCPARAVMSSWLLTVPPSSLLLKLLFCCCVEIQHLQTPWSCIRLHEMQLWLMQLPRIPRFLHRSCLVLAYHTV